MAKLKIASVFCGCGGMDLGMLGGFEFLNMHYNRLPFEIAFAIDNDKYAASLYNDNFTHSCIVDDVCNIDVDDVPKHDILIGGFPCQSFSIVAQNPPRLGYKDIKGQLFFEMVKILKAKQPRIFIAENVKGLLSANNKKAFPMIIKEFESAGYHIKHKLLNASDFGIPQKRERIFIVGFKNIKDYNLFEFPLGTTTENKIPLEAVLNNREKVEDKYYFSNKAVAGMLKAKDKMNKGRVQNLTRPCNTISSHLAKVSLNGTDPVLIHNDKYRRFTPKEAANIQSFPDTYNFNCVSENRQYKAIGNAVPPVLMWHLAQSISLLVEKDFNKKSTVQASERNSHYISTRI